MAMFCSQAGARPRTWEASPPEHKKWVEVFKACDEDNKGYLSREDFKVAVVMLFGYKPSKIEADSVMSSVDPNTSGIRLKEFLDIVRKKKEAQLYRNEVRHIFTAFDRHYRGYLTLEDFKKAFKQVAPKLSERIILEVFRAPRLRNSILPVAQAQSLGASWVPFFFSTSMVSAPARLHTSAFTQESALKSLLDLCVRQSCVQLYVTPWTVAQQALLSVGFSRQEYWSGSPFPSPGDLPDPESESPSPESLKWQADS
ncbi:EF-hand calcium-binding domain-containing protein 11 isoform X2 [Bos indicus]|uniref:EF-hand calcium-binding domain-containing protein 11 isoform X2 n=1 Tax=Bos indicus TaxID=9915 RepID=A0ABM4T234_BOSIN